MKDQRKSKAQLIEELTGLRTRLAALEAADGERRYRGLFEESRDAIYISTRDGRLVEGNQAVLDLFGHTREEMAELHASQLYANPDDRERFRQKVEETGSVSDYEVKLRKKNGIEMECLLTSTVRRAADGTITGYQGIIRDITARKWMERTLNESVERFEQLANGIDSVFWLADRIERKLIYVNQAYERVWGRSVRSAYDHPGEWLDAIHSDDRERVRVLAYSEETEGKFDETFRVVRPDESIRWVHARGFPVRDGTGRVSRMAAIADDITERKRADDALRMQAGVLENMAEGVSLFDEHGVIEFTNPAFDAMFGYERGELIGKHVSVCKADQPDENARIAAEVQEQLKMRGVWIGEFNNRKKDGTLFTTHARISVLEVGGRPGAISVQEDITERREAEETLRKYKSMVSASRDLMVFVDPTYTYRAVNAAYCDAHRKTQEEILGHTVVSVLGQKLFETTVQPNLDRCLAGEQLQFELWWDLPALGRRHVDARYDPFYEADGSVSGVVVHIRDDTDRQMSQDALRTSRERLRNLAARLHAVREEERAAAAREIHDELAQALTGLKMDISWLMERLPGDGAPLLERAHAMASLIDTTIGEVRHLSSRLRPAILDDLGLEAAIEWQAQEFARRTGVELELKLKAIDVGLGQDRATAIFRILQETLTNVARHAEASCVEIHLGAKDGTVVLEVQDDGKGITEDALASTQSIGLIGMRERAGALGGQVDIHRVGTGGTAVILRMPVGVQEPSEAQ